MANASIGGLVSGLDTATIISQLMQLEARPQTSLKSRVSSEQRVVNALQTLNSKLAGIAAKAVDLAKLAHWTPTKGSSSADSATVSTSASASVGSVTFDVVRLAQAFSVSYEPTATAGTAVVPAGSTFQIDFHDGQQTLVDLETGDGSLASIAKALNASGTGVTASVVKVSDTDYRLQVQSSKTGVDSGFTLLRADGTTPLFATTHASTLGADAEIRVAGEATTVTSPTNTFADLMPGVSITLSGKPADPVTITVSSDPTSLSDKVKGLIEAVNSALSEISTLTASGSDPKTRGLLPGDSTLRTVRNRFIESVTGGVDGRSLAAHGIQTDRMGRLDFDEAKFKAAYNSDPEATMTMFAGTIDWPSGATGKVDLHSATWRTAAGSYTVDAANNLINGSPATRSGDLLTGAKDSPVEGLVLKVSSDAVGAVEYKQGFAAKLESLAQAFSDPTEGTVSMTIQSRQSAIRGWEDDIADWDIRLAARQTTLQRQYTALESALGKLQSQGSWLAGQIASLPQMSSGS